MTATQFYFPYFFDIDKFNKSLSSFGLSSYFTRDDKTNMPKDLIVTPKRMLVFLTSKSQLLTIPFGATLMIQDNKLFYWVKEYDTIIITQVQLNNLVDTINTANQKVDLKQYSLGHNQFDTDLDLFDFVTYIRKEDLKYNQDYYEKFVLVFINKNDINIIPFDWFNKSGGDYGYVWPATARFDKEKGQLRGQGMRMADFVIDIERALLQ